MTIALYNKRLERVFYFKKMIKKSFLAHALLYMIVIENMNNLAKSLTTTVMFIALSTSLYAEVATKDKPLKELKIGEKVYNDVYVHEYKEDTGKVILEHMWGSKGVNLEELTDEQKKALGVASTLSAKELAKNREASEKKHQAYVNAENKKLAEMKAAKPRTTSSSNGTTTTTSTSGGYKKVVTKQRVG